MRFLLHDVEFLCAMAMFSASGLPRIQLAAGTATLGALFVLTRSFEQLADAFESLPLLLKVTFPDGPVTDEPPEIGWDQDGSSIGGAPRR